MRCINALSQLPVSKTSVTLVESQQVQTLRCMPYVQLSTDWLAVRWFLCRHRCGISGGGDGCGSETQRSPRSGLRRADSDLFMGLVDRQYLTCIHACIWIYTEVENSNVWECVGEIKGDFDKPKSQ